MEALILSGLLFQATLAAPALGQTAPPCSDILERLMPAPREGSFQLPDYWVWGSSVIRGEDGRYHMYVSRWPKSLPFHPGWMIASEIAHAVADAPEGPYEFSDVALPARGAQYWDGRSTHNPKILRYKDTYVLFYMGSTHPFEEPQGGDEVTLDSPYAVLGRANKRIGIATATSPYGPWERRDAPVLGTQPGTFYSFLTSNPAPWIEEDGGVILLFKSRAYRESFPYHGPMSIGVARADRLHGPYRVIGHEPIFGLDRLGEVEDPTIWKGASGYHLLAKDQRGSITGRVHDGIEAVSADGIHWELCPDPLAYTKTVRWSDGTTEQLGHLERVSVLIEDGEVTHLFFAAMDGPGGPGSFNLATRSWNMVIPLRPRR